MKDKILRLICWFTKHEFNDDRMQGIKERNCSRCSQNILAGWDYIGKTRETL